MSHCDFSSDWCDTGENLNVLTKVSTISNPAKVINKVFIVLVVSIVWKEGKVFVKLFL